MARLRPKVNFKQANLEFQKQFWATSAGQNFAKGQAQVRINRAHDKLKAEYYNHPVTLELRRGADASQGSNFIRYAGARGEGSLFTFLGFYSNDKPLADLDNMIERRIVVPTTKPNGLSYSFTIRVPSIEEAQDRTKNLPWTNASWVQLLESSLPSNIMHYVVFPEGASGSRSTKALQLDNADIDSAYPSQEISYINQLIESFNRELERRFSGGSSLVGGSVTNL